jgi:hypothetical protein
MSALWNINVLETGKDWAILEVRQAHPDAGPFPESRGFALRLLHEQAWELDSSGAYKATSPLGKACDSKQVLDESWIAANAGRLIAAIATEGPAREALDEDAAVRLVADQLGMGGIDQLSEAERARFDAAYDKLWKDPAKMPARRYRITVADPAFVSHLAPGATWASAAY